MIRRAAKRDFSEADVIKVLEAGGAYVFRLHQPVDLLIGFRGRTYLAEVKTGKAQLNENQKKFIEAWNGGSVPILRNMDDAENWLKERVHA